MSTVTPTLSRDLACRLHQLALSGARWPIRPAYHKDDAQLRRMLGDKLARNKPPRPGDEGTDPTEAWDAIRACMIATGPPAPDPWFDRRWRGGEESSMRERGATLAEAVARFDLGTALRGHLPLELQTSPALMPLAVASWGPRVRVVAGPTAPAGVVLLAAIAALVARDLPLADDPPGIRALIHHHLAGAVAVRIPTLAADVEVLLNDARGLLPQRQGSARFAERVRSLASRLPQAHGEVERIAEGLAAGRTDRMHRAWLRAFFAPRGFDLDAWVSRHAE